MNDCTLCDELMRTNRRFWNEPLVETANFVVLPSLGSLVEGWVLTVPKQHVISTGGLPPALRSELDTLTSQVRNVLREIYGKPIVEFEHGPSAAKHGTGCGVDHAHLHLVPIDCDLQSWATPFLPTGQDWLHGGWTQREEAYRGGLDYLYLRKDDGQEFITVSADFGSQIFRRAIAEHLGIADRFNWRTNSELSTVRRTIEAFRGLEQLRSADELEHVA